MGTNKKLKKGNYGSICQLQAVIVSSWQLLAVFTPFSAIMSSNIRLKKVCQHCGNIFTARTTVTKYCSDACSKRAYKKRLREEKVEKSQERSREDLLAPVAVVPHENQKVFSKELVNIRELSMITSLSERTLFRLIKDKRFPKMKVGDRLVFNKDAVINYLNYKYGSV